MNTLQLTKVVAALILSPPIDIGEPDKRTATMVSTVPVSISKACLVCLYEYLGSVFKTCL